MEGGQEQGLARWREDEKRVILAHHWTGERREKCDRELWAGTYWGISSELVPPKGFLQWCWKVEFIGPVAILWGSPLAQAALLSLRWPHKSSRSCVCSFSAVRLSDWSLIHLFHSPKSAVTPQTCALVTAVRVAGDPCCVWHGQDYCLPKIFPIFFLTSLLLHTQRN